MKNNKIIILLAIILTLSLIIFTPNLYSEETIIHNYKPEQGYVPDKATAIKIAEAIWMPIYGNNIYDMKPFNAKLKNGVWTVTGTLPGQMKGGVPVAEILKDTGEIIRVSHGK